MKRSVIMVGLLLSLVFALSSCSNKSMVVEDKNVQPLQCVLVLPTTTTVDSSSKINYPQAQELLKGARYVSSIIVDELGGHPNVRIIDEAQLDSYFPEVKGGKLGLIKTLGDKLDCGAVMMTTVRRYKQREGGDYAVDAPASAAFDMQIIDSETGQAIWAGSFSETQQSVMSNLFSLQKAESRGFKWITVEDLIRQGVQERLEECPYL